MSAFRHLFYEGTNTRREFPMDDGDAAPAQPVRRVLHVAAENMSTYHAFTRRALHAEEHVRSFKTLVVLQQPKRAAPLTPPAALATSS